MCENCDKVIEESKALNKTNNEILNTFIPELKRVNSQLAYVNKFLNKIMMNTEEMKK